MKKGVFLLGLILLSSGLVYAKCCSCYENFGCRYYDCPPPVVNMIKRPVGYRIYYPMTGISVNVGNRYPSGFYGPMGRYSVGRNRGIGASVRISI